MIEKDKLRSLLLAQQTLYPGSKLQDYVKLIYQNEFGGGHLILHEEDSLKRLLDEWEAREPREIPPFEDIGNGLSRLNIAAFSNEDLSIINRAFVISSNTVKGTTKSFEQKLNRLKGFIDDGILSDLKEEAEIFIEEYKSKGYPPVSHSEFYRNNYKPYYRVIRNEFRHYWELFKRIDNLLSQSGNTAVCIDGRSAAGKSSLGELLRQVYDCNVIRMDHFFLCPEQKTIKRLAETGGNVDYERFREEVTKKLRQAKDIRYRRYDCHLERFADFIHVPVKRLNVVEGVYSMHPKIEGHYDLKVFLDIAPDIQCQRILERDGENMFSRFKNDWIPMENRYFKEFKIREQCDLVYDLTGIKFK